MLIFLYKGRIRLVNRDINIVISGEAGQGIEIASSLLLRCLKDAKYNLFCSLEYMSRIRGGCNASFVRIAEEHVCAPKSAVDILFALDEKVFEYFKEKISKDTILFHDKKSDVLDVICDKKIGLNFTQLAQVINGVPLSSIVCVGFVLGLFDTDLESAKNAIKQHFSSEEEIERNIDSLESGYNEAQRLKPLSGIGINMNKDMSVQNKYLISGSDALSLGCIAGGCNFISSYPMTPGTALFTFISQAGAKFDIVSEQAEDEIAAVNMAIGAWYAGARAMVSTSGGGFSLMTEGISLAGMIESPLVVHVAQRPAPATGLPTRTEQGDLNLVLYAGAGEFPRIILAPTTPSDAFEMGQLAFDMADKYQVPVFILTDQFFIDSKSIVGTFNNKKLKLKHHFVKSDENYKRYALLKNSPISPRAIPSFGKGLVCVDSDEHTDSGLITEDSSLRKKMVEKRLRKFDEIKKDILYPEFIGDKEYKNLIISWGSNYCIIKEILPQLKDTAFLCLRQLYPLHTDIKAYMIDAEELIIVENNATSQLGRLLREELCCGFSHTILKYDGLPFGVDSLAKKLREVINENV